MRGIVPAAGLRSWTQPLASSKELLPVGSRGGAVDCFREAMRPLAERR